MIHAVMGELVHAGPHAVVIRTNGGIEFELLVSTKTASKLSNLQGDARRQVRLLSWLQHRDDGMTLYGFVDEEERLLFLELIKVSGIGPRQAQKILNSTQVRAFVKALDDNDVNYLSSIPGIGPKTSQKIILALRDTIILEPPKEAGRGGQTDRRFEDLIAALVDMGYDKRQVSSVIGKLLEEHEKLLEGKRQQEIEEFLFRQAIIQLG